MNKKMKTGCVLLAIALLFILAVLGIFVFADVIIEIAGKRIAEKVVPGYIGTGFSVGDVKSAVFSGKIRLKDVVVGNPPDFNKSPYAIKLGSVYVEVDMDSIFTEKIIVKQVLIEDVSVNYERTLTAGNIDEIKKNIEARSSSSPKPAAETLQGQEKKKAFVIRNLDIRKGSISVTLAVGQAVSATVPLSDIHIENIGEDGQKPLYEIVPEVLALLVSDILKSVSSAGFGPGIIENMQKAPSGLIKTIKEIF